MFSKLAIAALAATTLAENVRPREFYEEQFF
jgi:hypothetical protein